MSLKSKIQNVSGLVRNQAANKREDEELGEGLEMGVRPIPNPKSKIQKLNDG